MNKLRNKLKWVGETLVEHWIGTAGTVVSGWVINAWYDEIISCLQYRIPGIPVWLLLIAAVLEAVLLVSLLYYRAKRRSATPLPPNQRIEMLGLIWDVTGSFQARWQDIEISTQNVRPNDSSLIKGPFCPSCAVPLPCNSEREPREACGHCDHKFDRSEFGKARIAVAGSVAIDSRNETSFYILRLYVAQEVMGTANSS